MNRASPMCRVATTIGLPASWQPSSSVGSMFAGAGFSELIEALRFSSNENARLIVARYDSLPRRHRNSIALLPSGVGIDMLISVLAIEPAEIAGIITTHLMRMGAMRANAVIATKMPEIVEARAKYALEPEGHADAKMLLQAGAVAPVPKNQVTHLTLNNSRLTQVNAQVQIPRLEDVTKVLAEIQQADEVKALPEGDGGTHVRP